MAELGAAVSLKTHTKIWVGRHNRQIVTLRRRRYVGRARQTIQRSVTPIHPEMTPCIPAHTDCTRLQ